MVTQEDVLYKVLNTENNQKQGVTFHWANEQPGSGIDYETMVWNGKFYVNAENDKALNRLLLSLYRSGQRCHFHYGKDGKLWGDIETGRIGRTTGHIPIPITVYNQRSLGGPALLDDCIIKITATKGKWVLYDKTAQ